MRIPEKDLPIAEYHASERVSTSKLKDFEDRGPRYYYARYVAKTIQPDPDTQAYAVGRAAEDYLRFALTNDPRHLAAYAVRPDELDGRTKAGKEWLAEHKGKTILGGADEYACRMIAENALANEDLRPLLESAEAQVTFTGKLSGMPAQSRPDFVVDREALSLDLKTTNDLAAMASGSRVLSYRYHAQAALVCGLGDVTRAALIVAEKAAPYRVELHYLDPEFLSIGDTWNREQSEKLAQCAASGRWPLTSTPVRTVSPPRYAYPRDEAW